jgi:hypothetical protein
VVTLLEVVDLEELRAQRFAYLRAVYDASEGNERAMVPMREIGETLGFDYRLSDKIVTYLDGEGLLKWAAFGLVSLTHWGLKEVEEALSSPEDPTEHFPPYIITQNYINIGTMTHSQIQQGTIASSQNIDGSQAEALRSLVADVRTLARGLELLDEDAAELEADLTTAEAQLGSPRPKPAVLREALSSTRSILEGIAAIGLAANAPELAGVIERLGHSLAQLPL